MTDTPKPSQEASEAWQDVDQWVQRLYAAIVTESDESLHESLRAVVVELRAADAQQSAAHTAILQAVLDAIKGTLDPSTQIADHPNVQFAQMERLKLEQQIAALHDQLDIVKQQVEVLDLLREADAQQSAALRAENDQNGR